MIDLHSDADDQHVRIYTGAELVIEARTEMIPVVLIMHQGSLMMSLTVCISTAFSKGERTLHVSYRAANPCIPSASPNPD